MQIISTRNATKHEFYEKDTLKNDIAIIVLPSDVSGQGGCSQTSFFRWSFFLFLISPDFYLDVAPIRLPARSQIGETFADQTGRVSGWGRTKDRKWLGAVGFIAAVCFVYMNLFNMLCSKLLSPNPIFCYLLLQKIKRLSMDSFKNISFSITRILHNVIRLEKNTDIVSSVLLALIGKLCYLIFIKIICI